MPRLAFMLLVAVLLWAPPALAQQADTPAQSASQPVQQNREAPQPQPDRTAVPADLAEAQAKLEALRLRIDTVESALRREGMTDAGLAALRNELDQPQAEAQALADAVQPRADAISARLKQLGPAPEQGAPPESPDVAAERAAQNELMSMYQGIRRQAGLLKVRAEQIQGQITDRRRAQFADRIFEQRQSALSPALWIEVANGLPVWLQRLGLLIQEGAGNMANRMDLRSGLVIAGALAAIALLVFPLRRLLLRFGARDPALTQPSPLRKSSAAMWLVFVYALVPLAALYFLVGVFDALELLPPRVLRVASAFVGAVFMFSLIEGLAWALISPFRPAWRMLALSDAAARRLHAIIVITGAVYAIDNFLTELDRVLFAPVGTVIGREVVSAVLLAGLVAVALRVASSSSEAARAARDGSEISLRWLSVPAWLAVIAVPIAMLFGYLSLASFLASQLIAVAVILALLALALRVTDDAFTHGLDGDGKVADRVAHMLGIDRRTVLQGGVLIGGLLRLLLILVAVSLLLVPWGIESKDIYGWFSAAFFGFTIGDIRISPSTVLIGIVIFVVGLAVTRVIQHWLRQKFLPQTRLDSGVRNSLTTAFGYLGLIAAVLVAFTFAGIDLSNLALVAGALGVGIGFGLQSIVNNFVSGLILLAERPIKAGDWIVVGGEQGYVRKISVRSTEVETFDRASVIIPNSDLISGVVKNWTHSDQNGRVRVAVGVSYDSDPEEVRKVLLECAENHPSVARDPEPRVYFMNFGASSLDFELFAHVSDVNFSFSVSSDLRFAMFAALKKAGIQIPFPQRDIHLRDVARLEKALGDNKAARGNGKGSARSGSTGRKRGGAARSSSG